MRLSNCDRCYRRKGKCDRLKPCSPCSHAGADCTYSDRAARSHTRHQSPAFTTRPLSVTTPSGIPQRLSQTSPHTVLSPPRIGPVSEVSFLSLNAVGERQSYLGSSSGVLFADLVQSALDATVTRPASPERTVPTSETNATPYSRRADDLPPKSTAEALIQAYLNHDAILYPLILPSILLQTAQRLYEESGYHATRATAFEVFSFHMVLAIAMSRVQKYQWHFDAGPEWFNVRAMAEASSVLASDPTERLQSILLLCQYRSCSPLRDSSASMWHLIGVAARLCIELGMHRESSYAFDSMDAQAPAEMIAKYQRQEIRRRCFWSLIAMDRIVSVILGRPFALHDDDIDTSLPRENDDFFTDSVDQVQGLPRMSVANKIFRYRLLCGRISLRFHRKKSQGLSGEDATRATQALADELQEWHRSQPQLHGLQSPADGQGMVSSYLSPEWYDLLAANASLMLWRPYFSQPGLALNCRVPDRIFESASTAIAIYAELYRSRKINYNWITLQSVFLAGLSYISTVSQHFRQRRSAIPCASSLLTNNVPLGDVIRTTRACSGVLMAVGDRWGLPRHCHDVFDRLSDAVLADAMHCDTVGKQALTRDPTTNPGCIGIGHASSPGAETRNNDCASDSIERQSRSRDQVGESNGGQASRSTNVADFSSTLNVDNEFLSCFDDLQRLYNDQYVDDSVIQLSQDWLGSLGVQSDPVLRPWDQ